MAKVYISRRLADDTLVSIEGDSFEEFEKAFEPFYKNGKVVPNDSVTGRLAALFVAALVPTEKNSKPAEVETPDEPAEPEPPAKPARKRAPRKTAAKKVDPPAEPEPVEEPDEGPNADETAALIKKVDEAKSVVQLAMLYRKNKEAWTDEVAAHAKARREAIEKEKK